MQIPRFRRYITPSFQDQRGHSTWSAEPQTDGGEDWSNAEREREEPESRDIIQHRIRGRYDQNRLLAGLQHLPSDLSTRKHSATDRLRPLHQHECGKDM